MKDDVVLYSCSEQIFKNFVKKHNLKEVQGDWFHSSNFIDESGKIRAFYMTSSWSYTKLFQIDEFSGELETLELVTNIMNNK